ncbi:flagellar basal body-associated FliL family protein [Imhoffiella purpurea]|uniref:Flagellar protein FliL n=1 Tax=Imhoffiella purpurea TaxID=1249627 RepID=W9W2T8_9GAMM|nr:flagellar basal body-associated FliL family protein [Imhoffiella purpurea]EXJ16875.1 Flagellar biosynthesis protein FliL [Imhoffiella purpurea]
MADKKTKEPAEDVKASGGKLKLIILILLVLLVLGGGGGAAYYFLVLDSSDDSAEEGVEGSETDSAETEAKPADSESSEATAPASPQDPLIYHALETITVNITAPGSVRFLRINITIVTRNERVVAAIDKHLPVIRNDLLAHLSSQDAAVLNSREGKDELRGELLTMIKGILTRSAEPSDIVEVLFTDLVMQ